MLVARITYNLLVETLNPAQSINLNYVCEQRCPVWAPGAEE